MDHLHRSFEALDHEVQPLRRQTHAMARQLCWWRGTAVLLLTLVWSVCQGNTQTINGLGNLIVGYNEIRAKVANADTDYDGIVGCRVVVGAPVRHHRTGIVVRSCGKATA
jgi:hypothetical protein